MKIVKWMFIVGVMLGVVCPSGVQAAGDLEPGNAPGPTMRSLEELYQKIEVLEQRLEAVGLTAPPDGMVLIPAGEFVMGDTFGEGLANALPLHTVAVSAFHMDKTEVTKTQWDMVHGWAVTNGYAFDNPGLGKATNHPVHTVNWYDCVKWANARSEMEGLTACYTVDGEIYRIDAVAPAVDWEAKGYRLPTEAEWEKAARGGAANRRFPWSDTSKIQHTRANYFAATGTLPYDTSAQDGNHPDYDDAPLPYTSPAESFAPNGYGLFDMAGNIWEWCWDWYDANYYANSPRADPRGPASGTNRILRGGNWGNGADFCRVADRFSGTPPGNEVNFVGFRLVRSARLALPGKVPEQ